MTQTARDPGERSMGVKIVRWWWVRHAPVVAEGFCGWSDPEPDLSDARQLDLLKSALPEEATLISSDLKRAVMTADALARRTWTRLPVDAALREQNFGEWEGARYDVAPADHPFWLEPATTPPPGGESFADLCARVAEVVAKRNADADGDVVAVAHAGVIRAALALALDLAPVRALSFELSPLSLTRIDHIAAFDGWRIAAVNVSL